MRRPTTIAAALAVLATASALAPAALRAQLVEVPAFTVRSVIEFETFVHDPDIAAGLDGSVVVIWSELPSASSDAKAMVRAFSATGVALGPATRIDASGNIRNPRLAADTRGGFVAGWRQVIIDTPGPFPLDARLLGPSGAPITPVLEVTPDFPASHSYDDDGLPSGSVFAWSGQNTVSARLYDGTGAPRGPAFVVRSPVYIGNADPRVAATSDGGFIVTWSESAGTFGRLLDAAGTPLVDPVLLTNEFLPRDVAASPLGGFALAGVRYEEDYALPPGVWARLFDDSGTPAGPAFLVQGETRNIAFSAAPRLAYDPQGHLYVAWTGVSGNMLIIRGRGYDAGGVPLGPSFAVTEVPSNEVATAVRPDGRFANVWKGTTDLEANVVALCVPPYHTGCGDGIVTAPCEACDAGSANSDTLPNACRTTCQRASCGDGVIDDGEACDDGNARGCDGCDRLCQLEPGYACGDGIVSAICGEACDDGPGNSDTEPDACRKSCLLPACGDGVIDGGEECDDGNNRKCDGCSATCVAEPGLVCGDGIPEVACGEECDDGNVIDGDGCTEPCRLERIPGGGSPRSDCKTEWVIDNPVNDPRYDKHGAIIGVQRCLDGDPRCDFDGGLPGSCTFHLRVCANNTDISGCFGGPRLASWTLKAPSLSKAAENAALAAVRAALAVVPGAIVGPSAQNVCTPTIPIALPLRGAAGSSKAGKLTLKTEARLYTSEKDVDKLTLICLPGS